MSTNVQNGRARDGPRADVRGELERELDPERGRRTLAAGVLVFRVATLGWMVGSNLIADGFSRPGLAYASLGIAAVWTLWLGLRPRDQARTWALNVDLGVSAGLILVSAFVVPSGDVVSPTRLFFATAYPISTPLMWGMSKGVWGGLGSALVLAVALALTRPLNGVTYAHLSQFVAVTNGSVYYFVAGGTMGAIAKSLDRSAGSVRRAVGVAMAEQETGALGGHCTRIA